MAARPLLAVVAFGHRALSNALEGKPGASIRTYTPPQTASFEFSEYVVIRAHHPASFALDAALVGNMSTMEASSRYTAAK